MIKILIADDHAIVREGIRRVIEDTDDLEVVAEAGTGTDVGDLVAAHRPDVAVLDISMPGKTGLELTAELKGQTRILILSMHADSRYVLEAVKAGADGYVLKDSGPSEVRKAIRQIAGGGTYFEQVADQMGEGIRTAETDPLSELSPRETEVLGEIARGLTNKQIAAQLGISPRTVETHRESLMKKTGINSVAGLTKLALNRGLIE